MAGSKPPPATHRERLPALPQGTAANNALDFDDLSLPVQLLQQNEQARSYWHRRFCQCWWMSIRTPTAPSTT